MALTYYCLVFLLLVSMTVASSGKEYYGYTSDPKYNAPEHQPRQDLNAPKEPSDDQDISTPKHFPINRTPMPRHIPARGMPPAPKKPFYRPKPRYRMPRPYLTPVHKKPEYYPTPNPGYNPTTPVTPVYGLPEQNTPDQSPPSHINSPTNPPSPSPPVDAAPANNPLPPQSNETLI